MTILSHLQQIHNPIKKRNHKRPVDSFIANKGTNLTFFSADNRHQHSVNRFLLMPPSVFASPYLYQGYIYQTAAELLRKYGQSVNDICKYFDICIFGGAKPLHFSKHLAIVVIGAGNEARSQLLKKSQLILTERF